MRLGCIHLNVINARENFSDTCQFLPVGEGHIPKSILKHGCTRLNEFHESELGYRDSRITTKNNSVIR